MIIGIGQDIVDVNRFKRLIEKGTFHAFAKRIIAQQEFLSYGKKISFHYLAKRFSVKESFFKACGISKENISWHDILVLNNSKGAPYILLSYRGYIAIQKKYILPCYTCISFHISISDTQDIASTIVIIEKR